MKFPSKTVENKEGSEAIQAVWDLSSRLSSIRNAQILYSIFSWAADPCEAAVLYNVGRTQPKRSMPQEKGQNQSQLCFCYSIIIGQDLGQISLWWTLGYTNIDLKQNNILVDL